MKFVNYLIYMVPVFHSYTGMDVWIQSEIFWEEPLVRNPGVMLHVLMPVFPLYFHEGLSDGSKGLFASILLPVVANKQLQCVLKVNL